MKALFDANVLISALTAQQVSVPQLALERCEELGARPYVSARAFDEVRRILDKKFKLDAARLKAVMAGLRASVELVEDAPELDWQLPDPDDAHLFDAALYIGADCIVTGDKALWTVIVPGSSLKVISPRVFLEGFT